MLRLVSPDAEGPAPDVSTPAREPKYWAFLSYSHHDKTIAKRLQKQLETYRVPRRLVGRETSHGAVPARLSPVFRDRDELHAGSDLKASVQDALSRSRWLIVVCTPDAARSPWVNREIIEFKKLHGERRVLALIARGEPFASDKPGMEAQECFPPALRHALNEEGVPEGEALEPIAADMRREGDGPHRATLKLLAGMLGVAFDDLVRRDVQRRVRLLTAIASASVLGVVVLAFLSVLAVRARNDAQYQRQQAEGLIEFMLGDLRKKLEPVGRLEVLDSVGEKALAYYGSQEARKLDATALGHRSRAMHLIGEIRDLRGNPAEAQAAFEQAAATTAQLLAKSPNDGQRIFDHAQSVFWVGYAAWKRADGKTAEAKFQEYLELAQRLTKIDLANVDWQAEVAFGYVNVGMVQLGTGRPVLALESLRTAGARLSDLIHQRPELSFELAQNYGWRAKAYELLGDYELALDEQRHKLTTLRAIPEGDKNRSAQRGILNALSEVSKYELALGRIAEAEVYARASLDIAETLVGEDPKNLFWKGGACIARLRLVETLLYQQQLEPSRDQLVLAAGCVEAFTAAGTWSQRDSTVFTARLLSLAGLLATGRVRQDIVVRLEEFLARSESLVAPDAFDRESLAVEVANAAIVLGQLYSHDSPQRAKEAWVRGLKELAPYAQSKNGAVLTAFGRLALALGDRSRAESVVDQMRKSSYRHPVFTELSKSVTAARGSS